MDFILKKYDKLDKIFLEYDRILLMILRENKVPELYEKLAVFLPTCGNTSSTIDSFIKEFSYLSQDSKKSLIYSTLYNFIILLNYFNSNIYEDMKKALEFILSMINLISTYTFLINSIRISKKKQGTNDIRILYRKVPQRHFGDLNF